MSGMTDARLKEALRAGTPVYLELESGDIYRLLPQTVDDQMCVLIDTLDGMRRGVATVCADLEKGVWIAGGNRFGFSGLLLSDPERRGSQAEPLKARGVVDLRAQTVASATPAELGSDLENRFLTTLLQTGVARASVGFLYTRVRLLTVQMDWYEIAPDGAQLGAWTITEYRFGGLDGVAPKYRVHDVHFEGVGTPLVATTDTGVLQTQPVFALQLRQLCGGRSNLQCWFEGAVARFENEPRLIDWFATGRWSGSGSAPEWAMFELASGNILEVRPKPNSRWGMVDLEECEAASAVVRTEIVIVAFHGYGKPIQLFGEDGRIIEGEVVSVAISDGSLAEHLEEDFNDRLGGALRNGIAAPINPVATQLELGSSNEGMAR
jgi:hypothetical protein